MKVTFLHIHSSVWSLFFVKLFVSIRAEDIQAGINGIKSYKSECKGQMTREAQVDVISRNQNVEALKAECRQQIKATQEKQLLVQADVICYHLVKDWWKFSLFFTASWSWFLPPGAEKVNEFYTKAHFFSCRGYCNRRNIPPLCSSIISKQQYPSVSHFPPCFLIKHISQCVSELHR